mmetsp:Transcript_37090/g.110359  ORF Transcript_37090/g.110359 Transcript_37090/m.110359 type:complete len:219 (-) Transcript_37090:317-973(-)
MMRAPSPSAHLSRSHSRASRSPQLGTHQTNQHSHDPPGPKISSSYLERRSRSSRTVEAWSSLACSLWRLFEVAVLVGEPCRNRRESGGPLAQSHSLGKLPVALGSALAQRRTERDQRLCQDEDGQVGRGGRILAVDETLVRDVLAQVSENLLHDLWHQRGVATTQDDPGAEAHAVLQRALKHVVHGLLLRGDLWILGTGRREVVLAGKALVDLEVTVH